MTYACQENVIKAEHEKEEYVTDRSGLWIKLLSQLQ